MINKATLIGRVGKKDVKTTKNGDLMVVVSLATNKKFIDSRGNQRNHTVWHLVNFYNKLAEIARDNASVGSLVYIEGEIYNKLIEEEGKPGYHFHCIQGEKIQLLAAPLSDYNASEENKLLKTIPTDGINSLID